MNKGRETLSNRHERELAEWIPSTTQTPASGAVLEKHDGRSLQTDNNSFWRFRYEDKCTQKKSYSFRLSEWDELEEYAGLQGERPVWAIRFYEEGEPHPDLLVKADLVAIRLDDWVELMEEFESLRSYVAVHKTKYSEKE